MKLATSTGDFNFYEESIAEQVKCFKDSRFRYINLEQCGPLPEYFAESDKAYKQTAEAFLKAAEFAGVKYVVSHAPCVNVFSDFSDETYRINTRALKRSVEICGMLGIERLVVHASSNTAMSRKEFFAKNKEFYLNILTEAEKYGVMILTENLDHRACPLRTGADISEFIDYVNHPLLFACWDTAHGNITEESRVLGQYKNIADIGDKLKGLHISDNFGDCHHHSWPFAGVINFDSVMQGLVDVKYDGYFTFEASYTLLHEKNPPHRRLPFEYGGEAVRRLINPSFDLKKKAVDLLYETGKFILEEYNCFEE